MRVLRYASIMQNSRSYQLTAMENLDRLLIKSMIAMVERHLAANWVESSIWPSVVIADADTEAGRKALMQAQDSNSITIALSTRENTGFAMTLSKPVQTRPLLEVLNASDSILRARAFKQDIAERVKGGAFRAQPVANFQVVREAPAPSPSVAKRGGNLLNYLTQPQGRGIVDVRFAPGKSIMFNHVSDEYCTALSDAQIFGLAMQPVQETQHGIGQASSEWSIAKRVLPTRILEDLCWRVVVQMSNGVALPEVESMERFRLQRLPRLSVPFSSNNLALAKLLTRNAVSLSEMQRSSGMGRTDLVNFLNAAHSCKLLQVSNGKDVAQVERVRLMAF